ncbi:MAG TPA: molybdopterin molybdotransferase MoeA [Gemmatimonadaceae bacterium]|nr:molybdopterin molybdotransferase MoeA [Gemmatimonadaceae bacterium]
MLSVSDAAARIVAAVAPLPAEAVTLADALGCVLAEDVVSPITLPRWDNSAMDGYAVHGADIAGASESEPRTLPVVGSIAAGAPVPTLLLPGQAMQIMTGAFVPPGADTVVRVEDTDAGGTRVQVRKDRDIGKNIRRAGEDVREGQVAIPASTRVGAAQIGVLSSIGCATPRVHRRPRVAILGSGDELVELDGFAEVLAGRRIVSSNRYTLEALVRLTGGVPLALGHAKDSLDAVRALLQRAVDAKPDLIVTSAGVSVGEHDHTRTAIEAMGTALDFWRVRMRPGAPLGFGHVQGIPWIGLPGNPVSAMVTFELFVRPTIRRMLGHARVHRRPVPVVLDEPVSIGAKLTHFYRAIVAPADDGRLHARLTGPQGSGILTSMSLANALLIVPEDSTTVPAGETLHALLLGEDAALSEHFSL